MIELNRVILGDALEVLRELPDNFFDVGVTSPPYNKGERDKGWLVDRVKPRYPGDTIGPELESRHALLTSVWEIPPEKDNPHPAPFPIELPTRCIFSVLGDRKGVVLDPFAGSGTTLVAAKLMGHQFLGIEISPEYVKMAEERLKGAEQERPRVLAEMRLHRVQMTFRERKALGKSYDRFRKKGGLFE